MIKASKGAAHTSEYNIFLLQASLYNNILHPESTIGAFDVLIIEL
jgi:hypothetical protein